ncbi:glycosyltransferase 87 family protein [Micromonospora sp. WMMD882]|uniref:glycosyltransferase 87 family protein n=1 Tax=Micromonospora sp. WMMD882 TaxID=3015151 RepID=UPI00248B55BB|nr:glycosyltransferase 87 family protein [Micromonospora sp. WMMD882]WBB81046.1 glycosyltransferase 87 family protein [Micromonospora sp. WMMD882]
MRSRAAVALWSVFGVTALVSAALVLRRPAAERLSDLHIYYGAVRQLQAGGGLYSYVAENGGPFTYPPFAAILLGPVGLLSETTVQFGWLTATGAAVVVIAVALGRTGVFPAHRRQVAVAATACVLLLSAPVQSNLRFGQVSIFLVALAFVDGLALTPARVRGALIGLAAAVKLTPLIFVVYLLVAGRWRDAARSVAVFVGCALAAAVALPAESRTFWTAAMFDTSRIGNLASLGNHSVHGMLLRLGVPADTLPLLWATLVAVVCGVALLRARQLCHDGRSTHAVVLVGCASVAASPVSWTHHQIWPVLAAMLLVGARGVAQRVAGGGLLAVLVLSLGVLLSRVSPTPGAQFVFENARTVGTVALCLVGFGGVAVAAAGALPASRRRGSARAVVAVVAALTVVAVQPLPAGADPTFKAYTGADLDNPRYFFVCRSEPQCGALGAAARPIVFGLATERTKVRVNGVVDGSVARLEYRSAPGGPPRAVPLVEAYPGQRLFSFRSATLSYGRLVAYDAGGAPIATYTEFRSG